MAQNGHNQKPFGPHGEGCPCPWPDSQTGQDGASDPEPAQGAPGSTMMFKHGMSLHDLMFTAVSDGISSSLIEAINTCAVMGDPLTENQIAHLISCLMRGFATGKTNAILVAFNFANIMAQAQEPEAEAEPGPEKKPGLHDIAELFWKKPDDS